MHACMLELLPINELQLRRIGFSHKIKLNVNVLTDLMGEKKTEDK